MSVPKLFAKYSQVSGSVFLITHLMLVFANTMFLKAGLTLSRTYTIYLKPLLKDVFYLMPEEKKLTRGDYVILTREPSPMPPKKFYWNNIGEGYLLNGDNAGLMRLEWDFFGAEDIYMSLHPIKREGDTPIRRMKTEKRHLHWEKDWLARPHWRSAQSFSKKFLHNISVKSDLI